MTDWITDMTLAPAGDEWVLGQVAIDDGDSGLGTIAEVIIFDGEEWTDTRGFVVKPVAWARIEPFEMPAPHLRYEWESDPEIGKIMRYVERKLPADMCLFGLAIGHLDNGEGALVSYRSKVDAQFAMFDADAAKDILGDAQRMYQDAVDFLNYSMRHARQHTCD